jgi:hypothetical protein
VTGADVALAGKIRAAHTASDGTYGAPRITAELHDNGLPVNHKRVARVMRRFGVRGLRLRRRVTTTIADPAASKAPDLIGRDFTAPALNQRHVGDITYLPIGERGLLYLATAIDSNHRPATRTTSDHELRRPRPHKPRVQDPGASPRHCSAGSCYAGIDVARRVNRASRRWSSYPVFCQLASLLSSIAMLWSGAQARVLAGIAFVAMADLEDARLVAEPPPFGHRNASRCQLSVEGLGLRRTEYFRPQSHAREDNRVWSDPIDVVSVCRAQASTRARPWAAASPRDAKISSLRSTRRCATRALAKS